MSFHVFRTSVETSLLFRLHIEAFWRQLFFFLQSFATLYQNSSITWRLVMGIYETLGLRSFYGFRACILAEEQRRRMRVCCNASRGGSSIEADCLL